MSPHVSSRMNNPRWGQWTVDRPRKTDSRANGTPWVYRCVFLLRAANVVKMSLNVCLLYFMFLFNVNILYCICCIPSVWEVCILLTQKNGCKFRFCHSAENNKLINNNQLLFLFSLGASPTNKCKVTASTFRWHGASIGSTLRWYGRQQCRWQTLCYTQTLAQIIDIYI